MIHDILDSDVQFARGLIESNQPDAEVISALCRRGVEAVKASGLVTDLRRNLSVKGALAPARIPRAITQTPAIEGATALEPRKGEKRPRHRRSSVPWWFLIIAAIFLWALAYCVLHEENPAPDIERHEVPAKPSFKE